MNGDIYMKWLMNRLIPAFKQCFPGKRMALVLDNASYRHIKGENWYTPSTVTKALLACVLKALNINEMWVERKNHRGVVERMRFGQASYFNKTGKYAPSKEMQGELRKYLH